MPYYPMKFCVALLLLLSSTAAWAADAADTEPKLPESVQALIDKATQDVAKERAKYDAASKKVVDKLTTDLKKEVERATKTGNLKLALAVQAQLDEVSKGGVVAKVDERAKSGNADLLGDSLADSIEGTWNLVYSNGVQRKISISRSGLVSVIGGAGSGSSYKLAYDAKARVYVGCFSPDLGKPETYAVTKGKLAVNHWMSGGDWKSLAPSHTAVGTLEEQK